MRMKYMYHILKSNYETLQSLKMRNDPYKVGVTTYNRGKVENWETARVALTNVSSIPTMKDFCSSIIDNPYFSKVDDSFTIPYEVYQDLSPKYNVFLEQVKGIIEFCEISGFSVVENGFDIKMPETESFDDFAQNIDMFNKAINQCPYLNIDNEKIILKKTDIGSIWFEFCIITAGSAIFLSNLAKIVDKCIKIKSHYVTVKQQEENYRQAKLKNDLLANIIEANKLVADSLLEKCVEELKNEIPDTKLVKDDAERVKFSIETLSKLMEKGLEIYASIDAPSEVRDIFPTSDEMSFIPPPQKLLQELKEDE